jgi:hypothetical protein
LYYFDKQIEEGEEGEHIARVGGSTFKMFVGKPERNISLGK